MLVILIIFLICSSAVSPNRQKSILFSRFVIINLLISSCIAYNNLFIGQMSSGVSVYSGLFNITTLTQTFDIFVYLVSALIMTLTAFYPREVYNSSLWSEEERSLYELKYNFSIICGKTHEKFRVKEFPLIITFILCGSIFLMSSSDLISVFLSIELQSYGLYVLASIYRNSERSTGSGLTYFLLGGLSSCFILLGSALLYANTGTTNIDNICVMSIISEANNSDDINYWFIPSYLFVSLILISVGFLFKISAAPFHFWSPDVYDGVPTIVTTYLIIMAKISVFVLLLEIIYKTDYNLLDYSLKNIILISCIFCFFFGSVLGLSQYKIKKLFTYSTINNVGFMLLALSINTPESIQAYIFFIIQYTITSLNGFFILISIGHLYALNVEKPYKLKDKKNSPIQLIEQIRGLYYINPFIALSLGITILSLIGIPPMIGFFGKIMVLSAAVNSGHIFMALFAVLTSVIGSFYYLNLIKLMFFSKSNIMYPLKTRHLKNAYLIKHLDKKWQLKDLKEEYHIYLENSTKTELSKIDLLYKKSKDPSAFSFSSKDGKVFRKINIKHKDITLNSSLSGCISFMTILIVFFMFAPDTLLNVAGILSHLIFKG